MAASHVMATSQWSGPACGGPLTAGVRRTGDGFRLHGQRALAWLLPRTEDVIE
jgi:hypothetical protein